MEEVFLIDQFINDTKNMMNFLTGKKTYLVALAIAVVAFAQHMTWLTPDMATLLYGLLGATGLATTRAAIANK